MKHQEAQWLLSRYLPVLLFSITIIVTPWLSSDPINTPKFLLLTIAGAICCGLLTQNYRVLRGSSPESKVLLVLSGFHRGLMASKWGALRSMSLNECNDIVCFERAVSSNALFDGE